MTVMNEIHGTNQNESQQMIDPCLFADPPTQYRPVVFWSWNEVIDPLEVRRQLRLMKQAGLGGGFIHSRIGLLTDYLGDLWFEAVKIWRSKPN